MKRIANLPTRTYLGLVMLLGLVLRYIDISESSIWHDEGYTIMLVKLPVAQMMGRIARDVQPPLYYLLLHVWIKLFGESVIALRTPSALFMLATIPLAYLLMRRIWTESAARLTALFVATGPFLIRYSQETRMYGMVACLLLLGSYLLLLALEQQRWRWWILYALVMAAALYTHYYAIFVLAAHWLYMAAQTRRQPRSGLRDPRWWVANLLIVALFLPWLPIAYSQYTRIQLGYWIPRATLITLPQTLLEFLIFFISYGTGTIGAASFGAGILVALVFLYRRYPSRRQSLLFLGLYALLGPVVVWLISFGHHPIFVDRYFTYAAIAFYALLALVIEGLPTKWRAPAIGLCLALFAAGIVDLHIAVDHRMHTMATYVNEHYRPGDELISGEIYTYFDFTYYNRTGVPDHIWSPGGVSDYDEGSLVYAHASQIVVKNLASMHPASGHVWMIGKTGTQAYFTTAIPANWRPLGPKVQAGYIAVQEYQVLPRSDGAGTVQ